MVHIILVQFDLSNAFLAPGNNWFSEGIPKLHQIGGLVHAAASATRSHVPAQVGADQGSELAGKP
jgi:hypothetical protein